MIEKNAKCNAYYVREADNSDVLHAGPKARLDFESICERLGCSHIDVGAESEESVGDSRGKLSMHISRAKKWAHELLPLENAIVFVNFPLLNHSIFHWLWVRRLKQKNCNLVLFVHDLNILRSGYDASMGSLSRMRFSFEEKSMLKCAAAIIVHNDCMKDKLVEYLGLPRNRLISLECFDYLVPDDSIQPHSSSDPIVIAGNLVAEKSAYIYCMKPQKPIVLYGACLEGATADNVEYVGGFPPDVLPGELVGSYGLVWDGPSDRTCEGVFGEYQRINNPHKASLYISAGLPILVWDNAAIADFVLEHQIGIAGKSIQDLIEKAMSLSEEEYRRMLQNVQKTARFVRKGWYTEHALRNACNACGMSVLQLNNGGSVCEAHDKSKC